MAVTALAGLWLSWRIVAMLVIQFFAEDVVHAVEARHYPAAATAARDLTVAEQVQAGLGAAGRALLANLLAPVGAGTLAQSTGLFSRTTFSVNFSIAARQRIANGAPPACLNGSSTSGLMTCRSFAAISLYGLIMIGNRVSFGLPSGF